MAPGGLSIFAIQFSVFFKREISVFLPNSELYYIIACKSRPYVESYTIKLNMTFIKYNFSARQKKLRIMAKSFELGDVLMLIDIRVR